MVNLELYKIFVTVADEQNITRASEKLNLTQPAVTKHIKNLEDILQLKLLVRSNHGINLTKEGQVLYKDIKDATKLLINIESKYYKTRDINLGIHTTILNKTFSECISKYYIKKQKSKINTINHENEQMIIELKNKEIDIIFSKKMNLKNNNKNIKFIKLGNWNDVLIANENCKWKNKQVTIEDIKSTTIYIIKNSNGIGLVTKEFVTEEIIKNNLCILNTQFKINPIEFGMYINDDNRFESLNELIQIAKDTFIYNKK